MFVPFATKASTFIYTHERNRLFYLAQISCMRVVASKIGIVLRLYAAPRLRFCHAKRPEEGPKPGYEHRRTTQNKTPPDFWPDGVLEGWMAGG